MRPTPDPRAAALADTGQDLHRFVAAYRELYARDVLTVSEPVGADQDVTALVWTLAARGQHPALVFEQVRG